MAPMAVKFQPQKLHSEVEAMKVTFLLPDFLPQWKYRPSSPLIRETEDDVALRHYDNPLSDL